MRQLPEKRAYLKPHESKSERALPEDLSQHFLEFLLAYRYLLMFIITNVVSSTVRQPKVVGITPTSQRSTQKTVFPL